MGVVQPLAMAGLGIVELPRWPKRGRPNHSLGQGGGGVLTTPNCGFGGAQASRPKSYQAPLLFFFFFKKNKITVTIWAVHLNPDKMYCTGDGPSKMYCT